MKKKLTGVFIVLFCLSINSYSQMFIGAKIKDANFMAVKENIAYRATIDYSLELRYQIQKINISLDWGRVYRTNVVDKVMVDTENDRLAMMVNYLPVQAANKFDIGMGLGYFMRIPYKITSSAFDTKYHNSGLTSEINLNFYANIGIISLGLKSDIDLYNSKDREDLKLKDYGFYIGVSSNISKLFKKS